MKYVQGLSVSKTHCGDYFNAYMAYVYNRANSVAPLTARVIGNALFDIFSLVDITSCKTVEEAFNKLVDVAIYPSSNSALEAKIISIYQACDYTHDSHYPYRADKYRKAYDAVSLTNGIEECAKDYLITLGAWGLTGAEKDYSAEHRANSKRAGSFIKLFED